MVDIVQHEVSQVQVGMSSREANRARRKARLVAKQKSRENSEAAESGEEPDRKKLKSEESFKIKTEEVPLTPIDSVPDSTGSWGEVICLF